MPSQTVPIVGMFYRPPAKALIAVMSVGTKLTLLAEPDNPYDSNAIAVWLDPSDFSEDVKAQLPSALADFGFSLDDIMAKPAWHLGYVPKEIAAQLRATGFDSDACIIGAFRLSASGAPRVAFEL